MKSHLELPLNADMEIYDAIEGEKLINRLNNEQEWKSGRYSMNEMLMVSGR